MSTHTCSRSLESLVLSIKFKSFLQSRRTPPPRLWASEHLSFRTIWYPLGHIWESRVRSSNQVSTINIKSYDGEVLFASSNTNSVLLRTERALKNPTVNKLVFISFSEYFRGQVGKTVTLCFRSGEYWVQFDNVEFSDGFLQYIEFWLVKKFKLGEVFGMFGFVGITGSVTVGFGISSLAPA